MARTTTPTWVRDLRSIVKRENGFGWNLVEQSGKPKLTRRYSDGVCSSVMLPLPWAPSSATAILSQVQTIRSHMEEAGLGLSEAAALVHGSADAPSGASRAINWPQLVMAFQKHKTSDTGALKESTWTSMYAPVMRQVLDVLSQRPFPRDGQAVLARLRDVYGGAPGSTGRRLRIQYAAQLLTYAVNQAGADKRWGPPQDLSAFVGKRLKPKEDSTPITDEQLVRLLPGIPDERWRLLIELLACFGLRPVEAKHCRPIDDGKLEVSYTKRTDRGSTKPRMVRGIDPIGLPNLSASVLRRLAQGRDALPPLGTSNGATAKAITTYLNRRPLWLQLRQEAEQAGERLTPYSFRHGYALRAHEAGGLTPRMTAAVMGHSLLTHSSSYGQWTDEQTLDLAFAQAQRRLQALQADMPQAHQR
jgi:integrase